MKPADKFFEREQAAFLAALQRHHDCSQVGHEDYRLMRRLVLARYVNARTRIYLDTKYWIRLRDHAIGKHQDSATKEIHQRLLLAVHDRRLVVPATESLFEEVRLQTDPTTRAATCALVDQFSGQIALGSFKHRADFEVRHWLTRSAPPHPRDLVWTWVTHFFGELGVRARNVGEPLHNLVSKAVDDVWSRVRFSDIINALAGLPLDLLHSEQVAERLNASKRAYLAPNPSKTFKDVFVDECMSYVDIVWPSIAEHLRSEGRSFCGFDQGAPMAWVKKEIQGRIVAMIRDGTLLDVLPSMQIMCGAYAVVRSDPNRQHKNGDPRDIHHAMAALPYCDALFTDKPMRHLLRTRPLSLDAKFGCKVLAEDEEILTYLATIGDSSAMEPS